MVALSGAEVATGLLPGLLMVAVAAYCVARAASRVPGAEGHRRDLDAWHGVMGAGMAAMLLAPLGPALATAGLVLFGAGLVWSMARARRAAAVAVAGAGRRLRRDGRDAGPGGHGTDRVGRR